MFRGVFILFYFLQTVHTQNKLEGSNKRKLSDAELQDQWDREDKRQREIDAEEEEQFALEEAEREHLERIEQQDREWGRDQGWHDDLFNVKWATIWNSFRNNEWKREQAEALVQFHLFCYPHFFNSDA